MTAFPFLTDDAELPPQAKRPDAAPCIGCGQDVRKVAVVSARMVDAEFERELRERDK